MNIGRLTVLENRLRTLSVGQYRFDMVTWGTSSDPNDCGFAGCAIGWATSIPAFKYAGFKLDDKNPHPTWKELNNWNAVKAFFDITFQDASYLFDSWSYTTRNGNRKKNLSPVEVADRIRDFWHDRYFAR